jgi:prevent-host-death family protein
VTKTHAAEEADALAAYCQAIDRCYLLPEALIVGRHTVFLRTAPARNGQTASINFAADYELGAVAQLEERSDGIRKVEGSSPSSSTPLKAAVGMDEFHAKLAHYVRHAEGGNEVLVTRWGRPVAKLSGVGSG